MNGKPFSFNSAIASGFLSAAIFDERERPLLVINFALGDQNVTVGAGPAQVVGVSIVGDHRHPAISDGLGILRGVFEVRDARDVSEHVEFERASCDGGDFFSEGFEILKAENAVAQGDIVVNKNMKRDGLHR